MFKVITITLYALQNALYKVLSNTSISTNARQSACDLHSIFKPTTNQRRVHQVNLRHAY